MADIVDIMRSLEWGRTYKWEVQIVPGPPAPFDQFFPAAEVSLPLADVISSPIQGPIMGMEVPDGCSSHKIAITFYDGEDLQLQSYFYKWMKEITGGGGDYILSVDAACRQLKVRMLNSLNSVVKEYTYLVYPDGELVYAGSNTSGVVTYSLDFTIAGYI